MGVPFFSGSVFFILWFLIMMMMTMRMIADDTLSRDYRHTLDVLLIGRAEHTWIEAQRSIGDVIIGPYSISAQIYVHILVHAPYLNICLILTKKYG